LGIEAVLLDIDGTLLDSNDAHAAAWVDVGEELGYDIRFEAVRPLIGMGGDKVLPMLTGLDEESPEGKRVLERRGEIFRERHLASCSAFPGVRELLSRMRADELRLVIATSASGDDLGALLERAGVLDLIDAATHADDAEDSKPDPDIVQAALKRAGVSARSAVMIGDTPYDVVAARAAKVRVIAVRCGGWWDDGDFAGADAVYDDPADILAHYPASVSGSGDEGG
jgi:phosphoglycolate phosphatase-like HAD superfamily hydrolase